MLNFAESTQKRLEKAKGQKSQTVDSENKYILLLFTKLFIPGGL